MKHLAKVLAVVMMLTLCIGLLPSVADVPASAATIPTITLSSTTAVNPILDCALDFETFGSGGPFTVDFEWKATNIKSNDASDANAYHAFVGVTGTVFGTTTAQSVSVPGIKGTTNWAKVSFQFQNVGFIEVSGTQIPGNILRFGMWKAKGTMHIRNLTIKNAAGTVVYNLNTDPDIVELVSQMTPDCVTERDLSNLAEINEFCKWVAGQFSTGTYSAAVVLEETGGTSGTTTSSKGPVFGTTSSSTTKKPTTSSSTTKKPTTSSSTTKKPTTPKPSTQKPVTTPKPTEPQCATGHSYVDGKCTVCGGLDPYYNPCNDGLHEYENGYCINCSSADPDADPCTLGKHSYENGKCTKCGVVDPNYKPATTPSRSDNKDDEKESSGGLVVNPIAMMAFVLVMALGICIVVLYATGVFSKKK